jgi:pimeloyl-[acyl-carrier protein] methyl ester esterase
MSLHVEVIGAGKDLVMLHGWGMHSGVWDSVRDALSLSCRLHLVDLPGMGFSPAITPYYLQHIAASVREVIPANAALCGWSLGGLVAMQIALDAPTHIDRLLLVGSTPCFVNAPNWDEGIPAPVFEQFSAEMMADFLPTMQRFLALQAMGGVASREATRALRENFAQRPTPIKPVLEAALQILLCTDLRAALPKIALPTLLIHGERDQLAPIAAAHRAVRMLPDAQLVEVKNASHAPFISHPQHFVDVVTQFLDH